MKIACFSFTDKGQALGEKLTKLKNQIYTIHHFNNSQIEGGVKKLLNFAWYNYDALVFISATGIAIRMINPYINHKTKDPAVVVMDDMGKYSISLLSGHIGGANELANYLSEQMGSISVITTASDARGIDSIDTFAIKNNYYMEDMKSVTKITSMMVNGKKIGFYSEVDQRIKYDNLIIIENLDHIDPNIDAIIIVTSKNLIIKDIPYTILRPKNINIGIGCRKGVEENRIIKAIDDALTEESLSINSIKSIGTIEVKKDEQGIIEAAKHYGYPLRIFSINEIQEIEDKFEKSQFVKDTIGVYSVSEPVAYLLGGQIIRSKSKHNGITISISKEN